MLKKIFNVKFSCLVFLCAVYFQTVIHECSGFVSRRNAPCRIAPDAPIDGGLHKSKRKDEKTKLGTWNDGESVHFYCYGGYALFGNTKTVCRDGVWTDQRARCEETCPSVNEPYKGNVYYDTYAAPTGHGNSRYAIGTRALYHCDAGYRLSGTAYRTCKEPGYWDNDGNRKCNLAYCNPLGNFANGQIEYSKSQKNHRYPFATIATYKCNSEYHISGSNKRTCQVNENWSGSHKMCNKDVPRRKKCFPSMVKVNVENGESITMSELQIGDKVKTVSSTGSMTYSEVKTFLEKDPTVVEQYQAITTLCNESLILSGNHNVFARKYSSEEFKSIYAGQVSVGDEVLVQKDDNILPAKVINVSSIIMQGAYVPLTTDGTLLVNGVLASCYASFEHDLVHIAMTPIKSFPEFIQMLFGEDDGSSTFVMAAKSLGRLIVPSGNLWQ